MAIGVSFLGDDAEETGREPSPFQQAVQVLSMRVPRFPRGQVLAPAPLLQGPGGAGQPIARSSVAEAFARMAGLMPPQGAPMGGGQAPMAGMAPPSAMPGPRIVPGIDPIPGGAGQVPDAPVTREWEMPPAPQAPPPLTNPAQGDTLPLEMRNRKRDPWRGDPVMGM